MQVEPVKKKELAHVGHTKQDLLYLLKTENIIYSFR